MHPRRFPQFAAIAMILAGPVQHALGDDAGTFHYSFNDARVIITSPPKPDYYFTLQGSVELPFFSVLGVNLATSESRWELASQASSAFFYVRPFSIYAPVDSLGDGIDDIFKLSFGLDPLDPDLASRNSGFFGAGGAPLSWGEYYRTRFDRLVRSKSEWGREVSIFNFGLPSAPLEAFSREVSVVNGGLPRSTIVEVYSREVSVFSFETGAFRLNADSRELSVFNLGDTGFQLDAISRELTVFNGEVGTHLPIKEAYSTEVSVFNRGVAIHPADAISREVSVHQLSIN